MQCARSTAWKGLARSRLRDTSAAPFPVPGLDGADTALRREENRVTVALTASR